MIKVYYENELIAIQKGNCIIKIEGVPNYKYPLGLFGFPGFNDVTEITVSEFYEWFREMRTLPDGRPTIDIELKSLGLDNNSPDEWIRKTGGESVHDKNRFEI